MKLEKVLLLVALLIGWSGVRAQDADGRIVEIWTCTLNEGHTEDDVHAVNARWLAFMNAQVEGGDIRSYLVTHLVGDEQGFLFLDSFPNLESWTATKAASEADEGLALGAEIDEHVTCASNTLHRLTES